MVAETAVSVATGARILAPLIKDLYERTKKAGGSFLGKWEASQFPRKLAKKIGKIESVKTLWQFDKEVRLTDFYYPAAIEVEGGRRKLLVFVILAPVRSFWRELSDRGNLYFSDIFAFRSYLITEVGVSLYSLSCDPLRQEKILSTTF